MDYYDGPALCSECEGDYTDDPPKHLEELSKEHGWCNACLQEAFNEE